MNWVDGWTDWTKLEWFPNVEVRSHWYNCHVTKREVRMIDPDMKAWRFLEALDWCQGYMRADKDGVPVTRTDDGREAVQFCALGAIQAVYGPFGQKELDAVDRLRGHLGVTAITNWNDDPERTKEQVIEAMRKANV